MKETNRLQLPNKLEPYRAKLENSIKPFIRVTGKKGTTLLWESKFCGNPYVPIGYEYPKDKDGTPMKLLAQINFEEVPIISPFPNKGILQFYISPEDEVYGMNFNHPTLQENFKVIYLSDIIKDDSKLISNFSFCNIQEQGYFPIGQEARLYFNVEEQPVSVEDYQFEKMFGTTAYNLFKSIEEKNEKLRDLYVGNYAGTGHKMGGYAFFTQYDPRENGYSDYNILLLQIDTDDKLDIMWGDCGVANFFIKQEDLMNLDFSNVLYNWDCC